MISIYLTILISMLIIRVFVTAIYMIVGKKTKLTEKERFAVGITWLITCVITVILLLQEVIFI